MPAPTSLVQPDEHLTPNARLALHTVTGVPMHLLDNVRVKPATENWLRAPWYKYHRGGAMTIGRTIWFTRKWFDAEDYGDGSLMATWNWLQHLAHEVGHLPQAERFGYGLIGKARYVMAFTKQYGGRAATLKHDVHDGAPLEIEADKGRWTLLQLVGDRPLAHSLVLGLHEGDAATVTERCRTSASRAADLWKNYDLNTAKSAPRPVKGDRTRAAASR
jgi:hypothetical protein